MALTGFLVNIGGGTGAICADSAAHAIDALGARFPYISGSAPVMCSLNGSVFTAPNSFTNTITCHDLTSGQMWTLSHPLTLPVCDPTLPIGGDTVTSLYSSLHSIFDMPLAADVATIWALGFVVPLACYLGAWAYGSLIGIFKQREDVD